MKNTTYNKDIKEHLDKLTHEINELKSLLVYQAETGRTKTNGNWHDLLKASEEISNLWKGYSAVEEIRKQRENI